ncbi:MAG: HDIG domain-containing protein [Mediterranea sp.]|jgi:uncharacterized protein|nr:HDIG domain-containing protein [Mediterranea sp.]
MTPLTLIDNYYPEGSERRRVLLDHSRAVTAKALAMVDAHPELEADRRFVAEAAMLHDIGIFLVDAPDIDCHGSSPYIAHGYLGAELVRQAGYPRHALVCERHTGAGITLSDIIEQRLPIPHREMLPVSIEEQIICFADKFFSKNHLDEEKSVEKARQSLLKFGNDGARRFDHWCTLFL